MIKKNILSFIFIIGLIYIVLPGPSSINDFSPIPNSLKSDEPGDTVEVSNVAAYFSQFNREDITNYYRNDLRSKYFFGKIISPLSINRPPQEAYIYIKDLQMSTFLEEYVYPLRSSIYVNGYEPHIEAQILNIPPSEGDIIHIKGQYFKSKTTIRFYSSEWYIRLTVYFGIWVGSVSLWKLYKKALKEKTYG